MTSLQVHAADHTYSVLSNVCIGVYGESDSDSDTAEGSKITLAYKSKRTSEREGLEDMGATLTLETESTTKV